MLCSGFGSRMLVKCSGLEVAWSLGQGIVDETCVLSEKDTSCGLFSASAFTPLFVLPQILSPDGFTPIPSPMKEDEAFDYRYTTNGGSLFEIAEEEGPLQAGNPRLTSHSTTSVLNGSREKVCLFDQRHCRRWCSLQYQNYLKVEVMRDHSLCLCMCV